MLLTEKRVATVEHRPRHRLAPVERRAASRPAPVPGRVCERDPCRLARPGPSVRLRGGPAGPPGVTRRREIRLPARCAKWLRPVPGRPREVGEQGRIGRAVLGKHAAPLVEPREIPAGERLQRGVGPCRQREKAGRARGRPLLREPGAGHRRGEGDRDPPRGTIGRDLLAVRVAGARSRSPYPSTTTCAFVPEIPNALTPARRGRSVPGGQVVGSDVTRTGSRSQSTCGFGSSKCRCFGMTRWRMARTTLMMPATPAAASRWPMFVFAVPMRRGRAAARPLPYTAAAACTSMGSPKVDPVPCASR